MKSTNHIRLFNPENDIMLQWPAAERRTHTLTEAVESFRCAGAMLPVWWSQGGDAVVVPDSQCDTCSRWLDEMTKLFPMLDEIKIAHEGMGELRGAPWGWSSDAARKLTPYGALCPDVDSLERIRQLSHRRTGIAVMERLHRLMPDVELPMLPIEVSAVEQLAEAFRALGGDVYMKSPWSSSGRGVVRVSALTAQIEQRAAGIIRRQGSVTLERALDGVQDFAMLFRMERGRAHFEGYSLFFNSHGTSYGGNLLASDAEIESRLVALGADRGVLHRLQTVMPDVLSDIIGDDYEGWLGVDMLVARGGMVNPCIELNLRMTMGVVAHELTSRLLAPGVEGRFTVAPVAADPTDHEIDRTGHEKEASPRIAEGRLAGGVLYLTPPGKFAFKIEITSEIGITS